MCFLLIESPRNKVDGTVQWRDPLGGMGYSPAVVPVTYCGCLNQYPHTFLSIFSITVSCVQSQENDRDNLWDVFQPGSILNTGKTFQDMESNMSRQLLTKTIIFAESIKDQYRSIWKQNIYLSALSSDCLPTHPFIHHSWFIMKLLLSGGGQLEGPKSCSQMESQESWYWSYRGIKKAWERQWCDIQLQHECVSVKTGESTVLGGR